MAALSVLPTDPFHGYAAIFSPFSTDKVAVAGGVNYGIAGAGGLIVYNMVTDPNGLPQYKPYMRFDWKDVLCDLTWSEIHEPILVAGSGDGHVIVFDQSKQEIMLDLKEHTAEVSSVEWNLSRDVTGQQLLLSGSWDNTIKMLDCVQGVGVSVWEGHTDKVYKVRWSPKIPSIFSSVSGDGSLRIWDIQSPQKICGSVQVGGELLTCSWNKYNENIIATAGTDKMIRVWDFRQLTHPLIMLSGHTQAIKCVSFDPHTPNILASTGYDSTVKFWNIEDASRPHLQTIDHHKEFTFSVDFSIHQRGVVVDCSWDKTLKVYTPSCLNPVTPS